MEKLVDCKRCQGNACYEQDINNQITTWMCFGCGFTTSTLLTEGSQQVKDAVETSPELYKDLMHTDEDKRVWIPATIMLPEKGMVFVDGSNSRDWQWSAVKAVKLEESDKKIDPDQTHRMDMQNVRKFGQKEFMDALEVIGFYEV
jgi:hypothetical protein